MLKRFTMLLVAVAVLLIMSGTAQAFSLLGPSQNNGPVNWQTITIGYNFADDIGGPMNRGEGYRWNVPVITYAVDDSFVEYFGNRGVQEVQKALTTFNSLTNFSQMSTNLNEYPLRSTRVNFRAQALGLLDLKSTTMRALIEELGLTEAERYVWTLRDRNVATIGNTTYTNYLVVQRNFDPVTQQPSSYVNGTFYTYNIFEGSVGGAVRADAVEASADPVAFTLTSVAYSEPAIGHYFTSLTRDDIGGLRYLYNTNNVAGETLLPDTQIVVTNNTEFQLRTDDLGLLSRTSTNSLLTPTQMTNQYPGIQLASVKTNLVLVYLTNVVNGSITVTPAVTNTYDYSFLNTVTNFNTNLALISLRTVEVTSNQFGFQTNILSQTNYYTNDIAGSFYIITNGTFAYDIIAPFNVVTQEQKSIVLTNFTTSLFYTNNSPIARVVIDATNDLFFMQQFTATNPPATVLARYPGLLITSTNIFLTNLITETYTTYTTNYPYDPAYVPAHLVTATNITTNVITGYNYTFGNVVTNQFYTDAFLTYRTITVAFGSPSPYAPAGTLVLTTNITVGTSFSPSVNGTFYIVPTNLVGYNIIATNYESPTAITNTLLASSGTVGGVTLSNITQQIRYVTNSVLLGEPILVQNPTNVVISATGIRQELVRISTNVTFKARALQLANSATMGAHVRRGVDKLNFRPIPFDSVLGRVISPVTNYYANSLSITNGTNILTASGLALTNVFTTAGYRVNGQNYDQIQQRVVTVPDILFVADDLGFVTAADGSRYPLLFLRTSTANWIQNDSINGSTTLGGPGVIRGPIQISYNNIGPSITHQTPGLLDYSNPYLKNFTWGTFDGSGSTEVVYPAGTDLDALESLLLNVP